ncbi:hypothetical protein [Streptomyces sp. NPDC001492]
MTGQHAPNSGTRRAREQARDRHEDGGRTAEQDPGRRRATKWALRIILVLVGLVPVVLTFLLIRGFIDFDHAVRYPEDGFSDWQCTAESGTCGP